VKSILLATRSTSAFELGTIDAIWNGRFKKRLKKSVLTGSERSSQPFRLSSIDLICPVTRE
jgi:hypothetical protein